MYKVPVLLLAGLVSSVPVRRQAKLDQAATAQAQQFDATATRAFTATEIKTSDGKCWTIDPLGGDFRENLIPITTAACTGAKEQQWDVLTAGKHNNRAGFANVVSTLTNGCLNFDPRRAAGNQVLLFSCGGRADGEGQVTDSQLFPFTGGAGPLTLSPANTQGATCLVAKNGVIDQAACDKSAGQQFTFGAGGAATGGNGAAASSPAAASSSAASSTSASAASTSAAAPAASSKTTLPITKLDQAATAAANTRDDTATRAFSDTTVKTASGKCLQATSGTGDFRNNLVPIQVVPCDGSAGQKWDVITKGKHNNVNGAALIVNTAIQGCMNLDLRRQAGNQVNLFSCGGRADGEGAVTDSQLWKFNGQATNAIQSASTGNNANKCMVEKNGLLDVADCTGAAAQTFTFGNGAANGGATGGAAGGAAGGATNNTSTKAAVSTSAAASTSSSAAPASTSSSTPATGSTTTLPVTKLDQAATAAANTRDDTATRAFSDTTVKTANGKCLQATSGTGDFRNNLVPIQVVPCDGSAGQKWDVITKGKHNNVNGAALIVNTAIQGCMNLDLRRQAGNQVNLFSCGGRADGEGAVTDSQLWKFNGQTTNAIQSASTGNNANKCMVEKNGLLDVADCTGAAAQTFTFGNGAAAGGATGGAAGGAASSTSTKAAAATTAATSASAAPASTSAAAPATSAVTTLPITKLDQAATAAANQRDDTATRAFSNAAVKTADGKCLQAVSGTGDFRNNLVPITVETCNGSAEQKWDVITKGKHNNVNGAALIVNTAIQGCMNLDLRRQPGNQALLFSCGGRADGEGAVTDSQLWKFDGQATNPIESASTGGNAGKCLVNNNGRLDVAACTGDATQDFTFA